MPSLTRNAAIKKVMRQQHISRAVATEFVDGALKAIEAKLRESQSNPTPEIGICQPFSKQN
jgi:nucleoid DNA-binding protein